MDKKEKLRDALMQKFLELKEGIPLKEFLRLLQPHLEAYQTFHTLCVENLERYENWDSIKKIQKFFLAERELLLIQQRMFRYLVVDIQKKKVLESKEALKLFPEDFFEKNFNEPQTDLKTMYHFLKYNGDIDAMIQFYLKKSYVLEGEEKIHLRHEIPPAWVSFFLNLNTGNMQLSFQTKDQYLYEAINILPNFTLDCMQDTKSRIKPEKILEMVNLLSEIKIPYSCVPSFMNKEFTRYLKKENPYGYKI